MIEKKIKKKVEEGLIVLKVEWYIDSKIVTQIKWQVMINSIPNKVQTFSKVSLK